MKKFLLVIAIGASFIESSFGFNTDFLSYSPVFYFTAQDTKILQTTIEHALNNARDNSKVVWKNSASGAHGYVIPSRSTTINGARCRSLQIFSEANKVPGESTYLFCRINNDWKIVH